MKKVMLVLSMLMLFTIGAFAQTDVADLEVPETVINVATFGSIVGLVTIICTQISKIVSFINEHLWAKVLVAVGVGTAITMICWVLKASEFMINFTWVEALITGVAVGLSSAGFYDVIKALWSIIKPKEEEA